MRPFKRAAYGEHKLTIEHWMERGATPAQAQQCVNDLRRDTVYRNDIYQVAVSDARTPPDFPEMWELSIKRIDQEPIHDWRDFQAIKNELIGPEHEGVEVYPAESRLMDTANQYYMYVFKNPALCFPFGFTERRVATPAEAKQFGAKQRGFK